ncbi:MAG: nucleotide exchange factor GrpE [Vicingaceae bacterium]
MNTEAEKMDNSSDETAINEQENQPVAEQEENDENTQAKNEDEELSDLEKKDLEIKALNDKYLRLYSEFDNFRRRTQKEKLELYKTAGEDIFKSLLSVMDDFDRAKKSMEETKDYDSLKTGVDLIYNKLVSVFKANGAEPMKSTVGETFDSEIHEAVTQIPAPSKKMKGKIVDEIEKGYTLKDKVIRFAKVVVGQ